MLLCTTNKKRLNALTDDYFRICFFNTRNASDRVFSNTCFVCFYPLFSSDTFAQYILFVPCRMAHLYTVFFISYTVFLSGQVQRHAWCCASRETIIFLPLKLYFFFRFFSRFKFEILPTVFHGFTEEHGLCDRQGRSINI